MSKDVKMVFDKECNVDLLKFLKKYIVFLPQRDYLENYGFFGRKTFL